METKNILPGVLIPTIRFSKDPVLVIAGFMFLLQHRQASSRLLLPVKFYIHTNGFLTVNPSWVWVNFPFVSPSSSLINEQSMLIKANEQSVLEAIQTIKRDEGIQDHSIDQALRSLIVKSTVRS